jgi:hypothetical protein
MPRRSFRMSLVTGIWAQNGHKGFLELSILTGHDETDIVCHCFYLNREQTDEITAAMSQALAKGLGEPMSNINDDSPCEDFMEMNVILQFPKDPVAIGRPSDWKMIRRTGAVIGIATHFKMPAEITFTSEVVAEHAVERLLDNTLHTIELGPEVTRMFFCDGKSIYAQGLSAEEMANLDAQFQRLSDCEWSMRN